MVEPHSTAPILDSTVTFGMFHEFNHAISGHSAFLAVRNGLARLHEYGSRDAEALSPELHREVEYMADTGATETIFDYVERGTILRRLYPNAPRTPVLHRLCITGLSVMCAQWSRMNRSFGQDQLHPAPAARFAGCLRLYTILLQCHYGFGRWALIGNGAFKDVVRIAGQCESLLEVMTGLSSYGEGSEYWTHLAPQNLLIHPDDIRDLSYPPLRAPAPYRSRVLRAVLPQS